MDAPKEFSLLPTLQLLYRRRRILLFVTIAATLFTTLTSLFLSDYYKATTTFIPANPALNDPRAIFQFDRPLPPYGTPEDADRQFAIAQSYELLHRLVSKFHLYQHYGIDSTAHTAPLKMRKQLQKLYKVTKGDFGGLEISFEDTDPQLSADMANYCVQQIGEIDRTAIIGTQEKVKSIFKNSVEERQVIMNHYRDTMNRYNRAYGLASINLRQEALTTARPGLSYEVQMGMIKKIAGISNDSLSNIREGLQYSGIIESRYTDLNSQIINQTELLRRYETALKTNISLVYVLERASAPLEKSRPMRTLIIGFSALASFFLTAIFLLLLEQYKTINFKKMFANFEEAA